MDAVTGLRLVRDRMRARGWEVVEVPGWETRGHGDVLTPSGAVNHWTAGPRTGASPSLRLVTHGRIDLRNALCNTYSSRHPRLYIVAARQGWHAGAGWFPGVNGNRDLGHEAESSGPGDWTAAHLALVADLDRVQASTFGYPSEHVIDHFEWAPHRKVDRSDVGGPPWRRRILQEAMMPTRQYAQAVVGHTDVDIEAGRVLAAAYRAALVRVDALGRMTSVTHPGYRAAVGFGWVVGAARDRIRESKFPDGFVSIVGANRDVTAQKIAQTLLDHPPASIERRGRPW